MIALFPSGLKVYRQTVVHQDRSLEQTQSTPPRPLPHQEERPGSCGKHSTPLSRSPSGHPRDPRQPNQALLSQSPWPEPQPQRRGIQSGGVPSLSKPQLQTSGHAAENETGRRAGEPVRGGGGIGEAALQSRRLPRRQEAQNWRRTSDPPLGRKQSLHPR